MKFSYSVKFKVIFANKCRADNLTKNTKTEHANISFFSVLKYLKFLLIFY